LNFAVAHPGLTIFTNRYTGLKKTPASYIQAEALMAIAALYFQTWMFFPIAGLCFLIYITDATRRN
jgi:hypothetical protein